MPDRTRRSRAAVALLLTAALVGCASVSLGLPGRNVPVQSTAAADGLAGPVNASRAVTTLSAPSTSHASSYELPGVVDLRPVVILVPGWNSRPESMRALGTYLQQELGVQPLYAGVGDMTGDLLGTAHQIRQLAEPMAGTGRPVSVVALSAGGVAARLAVSWNPNRYVKLVTLASPLHGVDLVRRSHIDPAVCAASSACLQLRPDTALMRAVRASGLLPGQHVSVFSGSDTVVAARSARLPGVRAVDVELACPHVGPVRHQDVIHLSETAELVAAALSGRDVSCLPSRWSHADLHR